MVGERHPSAGGRTWGARRIRRGPRAAAGQRRGRPSHSRAAGAGGGDFERAHADARDAGACDDQRARPNPACAGWRSTASLALAHLGRREEAAALAEVELSLAERFGAPVAIARAMVARAVSEPSDQARISICRRALASLEASRAGAELESVRLRLELGSTLARLGRRIEGRELLRPALADADAVGASRLAQPGDRSAAVPQHQDGRDPPGRRLPQAGSEHAHELSAAVAGQSQG